MALTLENFRLPRYGRWYQGLNNRPRGLGIKGGQQSASCGPVVSDLPY